MVVLRLAPLCNNTPDLKSTILHNMELLRLHLENLNRSCDHKSLVLQYTALLDIGGMSLHNVVSFIHHDTHG